MQTEIKPFSIKTLTEIKTFLTTFIEVTVITIVHQTNTTVCTNCSQKMAWNVTRMTTSRYKVTELEDGVRHTTSSFRAPREYAVKFLGLEDSEEEPKFLHHCKGAGLETQKKNPEFLRILRTRKVMEKQPQSRENFTE